MYIALMEEHVLVACSSTNSLYLPYLLSLFRYVKKTALSLIYTNV